MKLSSAVPCPSLHYLYHCIDIPPEHAYTFRSLFQNDFVTVQSFACPQSRLFMKYSGLVWEFWFSVGLYTLWKWGSRALKSVTVNEIGDLMRVNFPGRFELNGLSNHMNNCERVKHSFRCCISLDCRSSVKCHFLLIASSLLVHSVSVLFPSPWCSSVAYFVEINSSAHIHNENPSTTKMYWCNAAIDSMYVSPQNHLKVELKSLVLDRVLYLVQEGLKTVKTVKLFLRVNSSLYCIEWSNTLNVN